ncbi:MAG: HAMP domain-containing histidine kinase, partial [Oceanospirillales bacterium]|nr:HAMP domain-containing histidine kinase [Oceanospirillales bacterium]
MTARGVSLERQIRHRLLLGLVVVFGVLLVLLDRSVTSLVEDFVRSRLQHDAESLISALQDQGETANPRWVIAGESLPQVYQRVHSGHYFILTGGESTQRSRSLWDLEISVPTLAVGQSATASIAPLDDQRWLSWQQGFSKGGTDFTLWIAEDIAPLQAIQRQFELLLLGLVMVAIPVLLLWQRLILRRGFARLEPLRHTLIEQSRGSNAELPVDIPEEVGPLVAAIRTRLSRSGEQIQRSRTALGNLAHELKRPLQQLHWRAQSCDDPELKEELESIHENLLRRIERELKRARIAGAPMPGQQFIPQEEVPHIRRLIELSARREVRFHSELPEGAMPYDRDDMIELLGNLLDNAWRFAASSVWLTIRHDDNGYRIEVKDDGPGVDRQHLERLSERGLRLD